MSEENGTAVAAQAAGAPATTAPHDGETSDRASGALLLAAACLLWLAGMLWSARATITGRPLAEMEVTATAYALPGVVSAGLVAGAAVALAALAVLGRGRRTRGATTRLVVSTGAGLLTGLLAALSIVTINVEGWLYAVVGGTVAAAATIGGAVGGVRAVRLLRAICWSALTVFAVGLAVNLFQAPLLELLGTGDSQASQANAVSWFAFTQSVVGGLCAGLVAYAVLRLARRRTAGADLPWPLYALAGAGPGLVLLITEGLTRTAGARVLDLAGKVSELELAAGDMLSSSRLNNALIVAFVGAVAALIAVGRTLGPAPEDD